MKWAVVTALTPFVTPGPAEFLAAPGALLLILGDLVADGRVG